MNKPVVFNKYVKPPAKPTPPKNAAKPVKGKVIKLKKPTKAQVKAAKAASSEYFAEWYAANKEALSEKRKQRYASDPEYRQKALDNRKKQLEANRGLSPLNPLYTVTFSEAAEELGITIWRLRNWRNNHYFPEPYPYGKFLYFTDQQMVLLAKLNEFIGDKPRMGKEDKAILLELIDFIFANWE